VERRTVNPKGPIAAVRRRSPAQGGTVSSAPVHGLVRGTADRRERLSVVLAESRGVGVRLLDLVDGLKEQRAAVGQAVEAAVAFPQFVRRLLMAIGVRPASRSSTPRKKS